MPTKSLLNPISLLSTEISTLNWVLFWYMFLYFYDVCMYPQGIHITVLHNINIISYMSIFNLLFHVTIFFRFIFHVDKWILFIYFNCYIAFPLYEYSQFIHSPVDGHLRSFQCLATMKNVTINIPMLMLTCWILSAYDNV